MANGRPMHPVALLLGSVAYLYSTISNVGVLPRTPGVLVETNYGTLRGLKAVSRNSRNYYEFRGIPYASPPVGDLRFEPPIPPANWTGIRDALTYGSRCWQLEFVTRRLQGSENCLYLNVATHRVLKKSEINDEVLYPVLVYIHGGLFMTGVSNSYRPKYFMDEDVVIVTMNYRLASFGFLNTGDGVVRGNQGLKDQNMALRWVQENIAYFGGDPLKVTLVGESAGGASTHLHMLSPLSQGLFQRAISQSGTALSRWAHIKHPQKQARALGRRLNCPTDSSEAMIKCLKSRSARSIARTHSTYLKDLLRGKFSVFGPTVEAVNDSSTFLAEKPIHLLRRGAIANPVPWINGVNSEEGLIYVVGVIRNGTRLARLNDEWNMYAPTIFDFAEHPNSDNISAAIREYYLGNRLIGMDTLEKSVNMFSDRSFFEDSHDAAVLQSKVSPVYSYYFSFRGDFALANILFSMSGALPEALDFVVGNTLRWISSNILRREQRHYGVCHSDELALMFNLPVVAREIIPGSPDYAFSRNMIKLWSSFARRGKPDKFQGVTWDPVEPLPVENSPIHSIRRLKMNENPEMIEEDFLERLQFWKSLFSGKETEAEEEDS